MRLKLGLLATAVACAIAFTAVPTAGAQSVQAPAAQDVSQQIVGTTNGLAYNLTATVTQIVDNAGSLQAVGMVTGTVTNTATGAVTTIDQALTAPVTAVASLLNGTGLSISLGPTNVSVLGTTVSLSPIEVGSDSGLVSGVLGQLLGLLNIGGLTTGNPGGLLSGLGL